VNNLDHYAEQAYVAGQCQAYFQVAATHLAWPQQGAFAIVAEGMRRINPQVPFFTASPQAPPPPRNRAISAYCHEIQNAMAKLRGTSQPPPPKLQRTDDGRAKTPEGPQAPTTVTSTHFSWPPLARVPAEAASSSTSVPTGAQAHGSASPAQLRPTVAPTTAPRARSQGAYQGTPTTTLSPPACSQERQQSRGEITSPPPYAEEEVSAPTQDCYSSGPHGRGRARQELTEEQQSLPHARGFDRGLGPRQYPRNITDDYRAQRVYTPESGYYAQPGSSYRRKMPVKIPPRDYDPTSGHPGPRNLSCRVRPRRQIAQSRSHGRHRSREQHPRDRCVLRLPYPRRAVGLPTSVRPQRRSATPVAINPCMTFW
jgi:hypothetical protein